MSVLSDTWIREMSKKNGMISPFEEKQVRGDSISYGLSSFGYDARVSDEFKIFTNVNSEIVDPKNFKPTNFVTKLVGLKFLGSTISEFTLVKILNSSETLASYPKDDNP